MAYPLMHYTISIYGASDVGLVRQNNEDFWAQIPEEQFCALADGMGGHQAGEIAARETVSRLCQLLHKQLTVASKTLEEVKQLFYILIQEVNQFIFRMGTESQELRGMGTTLCFLYFHPEGLIYGHVGDSRIYRLRRSQLEQLTHDHSLLREMIDLGQLNEQQAGEFAYKNIITKAIGTEPYVEPSIENSAIEAGDLLLMCSDGLTDLLTHEEIEYILAQTPENEMPKQLVKKAKLRGGYDNITVVLVKVQDVNEITKTPLL
jgi:PPM family protein phosphatase